MTPNSTTPEDKATAEDIAEAEQEQLGREIKELQSRIEKFETAISEFLVKRATKNTVEIDEEEQAEEDDAGVPAPPPEEAIVPPTDEEPDSDEDDEEKATVAAALAAPTRTYRPGDNDPNATVVASMISSDDQHALFINDVKVGEWVNPPTKQAIYRQINANGWRVRGAQDDNTFPLSPAAPAQRARTAGLDGDWLVARDNYMSRKGIHQGDAVRVRYRDADTGIIEVLDGDEVTETEIKWDRFDTTPPSPSTPRQATPTVRRNRTRAAKGRGLETANRTRVAGCSHAKVADDFLKRHGIESGSVVPVTYGDDDHALVPTPDGRTIQANWSRFTDEEPTADVGAFRQPTPLDQLTSGMIFVVYDPQSNYVTPPMVHNADNTYSPLGTPSTSYPWDTALVASMTILTESNTDD